MKTPVFFSVFLASIMTLGCFDRDRVTAAVDLPLVDGPPVTRSEVILTADRFARIHWTMTEQNRRGVNCGEFFVSDYAVGDRTGMGYKWGGWTDIDDFLEKIEAGYGTGTGGYVDYSDFPIDCVVGVSCTGFVSRAWKLNNKYTLCYDDPAIESKFCDICTEVPDTDFRNYITEGMSKGDAFINETHTILFVYETRSRKPMVMDSGVNGVRFRQYSWGLLADYGYVPIRYNNMLEDIDSIGTMDDPVIIHQSDLPLQLEGNTRDVFSMEIDYYSIAPTSKQRGPETIYLIEITSAVELEIRIDDLKYEGINNDIHLLGSLDIDGSRMALDCIAKGDYLINVSLDEGVYYIVVDSGNDLPGEYSLNLNITI